MPRSAGERSLSVSPVPTTWPRRRRVAAPRRPPPYDASHAGPSPLTGLQPTGWLAWCRSYSNRRATRAGPRPSRLLSVSHGQPSQHAHGRHGRQPRRATGPARAVAHGTRPGPRRRPGRQSPPPRPAGPTVVKSYKYTAGPSRGSPCFSGRGDAPQWRGAPAGLVRTDPAAPQDGAGPVLRTMVSSAAAHCDPAQRQHLAHVDQRHARRAGRTQPRCSVARHGYIYSHL